MERLSTSREVALNISMPQALGHELLEDLRAAGLPVEGLEGFSDSQALPISWGEILPLTTLWRLEIGVHIGFGSKSG